MLLLRRQVDLGVNASVETCPIIHLYMLPSYFRVVQTAYIRDYALLFDFPNSESTSTTCKTRPAGRVRPATRFCPAREMFLSYNGNRPAASHRPPLHYTIHYGIESLRCLPLHRLKTNVINNVRFVRQRSLERMMDCVY